MSLGAGTKLGPYQILDHLGSGGMGEVYRARDAKLGRDVAIKVLPASLANDPSRLARFEREAQLLAALNHPHIGAIYGFEDSAGAPALILELVEGPTLADVIAHCSAIEIGQSPQTNASSRGRDAIERGGVAARGLEMNDALRIAGQIAGALEAAHEKGIIHRDLKPANIKLKSGGDVKVLDFGLAKMLEAGGAGGDVSDSPTITIGATQHSHQMEARSCSAAP
jgi:eukaryotic-like serine/threonine-protein kinase